MPKGMSMKKPNTGSIPGGKEQPKISAKTIKRF